MRHTRALWTGLGTALASLLLSVAAPTGALATVPGANGRIAFTSNLHGSWQIYTMLPNGTRVRQVTHIPGSQDTTLFQRWAPNGRKLAFASGMTGNFDIYTINADGTGQRNITSDPADELAPAWSPDGKRIAFFRGTPDGKGALWSMAADGSHQTRLTSPAFNSGFLPTYTPDGRHIIYVSQKGGFVAAVWIMNVDGTNQRRLTPAKLEGFAWDVSPDGRHILVGNHGNTLLPESLYVMNINGSGLRRLTNGGCCFHDSNARYSHDGTKIAFTTDRSFASRGIHEDEIWEMNADGTHMHPVTSSVTPGGCPDEHVDNCVGPVDWGTRR